MSWHIKVGVLVIADVVAERVKSRHSSFPTAVSMKILGRLSGKVMRERPTFCIFVLMSKVSISKIEKGGNRVP